MDDQDDDSILAKLRAFQGQSQGTAAQQQGMSDAMARVRQKLNAAQPYQMPPASPSVAPVDASTPPGVGALSPQQKALLQQKVDAMNAGIKAQDDANTAANPQDSMPDQPADYLKNNPYKQYAGGGEVGYGSPDDDYLKDNGMAHGGMVKFHKLMQMMKNKKK